MLFAGTVKRGDTSKFRLKLYGGIYLFESMDFQMYCMNERKKERWKAMNDLHARPQLDNTESVLL